MGEAEHRHFTSLKLLESPQLTLVMKCPPPPAVVAGDLCQLIPSEQQDLHPWDVPTSPGLGIKLQEPPLKQNTPPPASSLASRSNVKFQNELEREKPALNCEWVRGNASAGWIKGLIPARISS